MIKNLPIILSILALSACASSETTRLANNMVRIDVSAAPACGSSGALRLVEKMAAVETIRLGFDKYIIAGTDSQNNVRVVGANYQPNYATGGIQATPIIGGSRDAAVTVVMFKSSDPNGVNAIDARQVLGANWQQVVSEGAPNTCT